MMGKTWTNKPFLRWSRTSVESSPRSVSTQAPLPRGPPRSAGAKAYTVGDSIVFGAGGYSPGTAEGRLTLAHELVHVLQQRSGPVEGTETSDGVVVSRPHDRFEREADTVSRSAFSASTPPQGWGGASAVGRRSAPLLPVSSGAPSAQRFSSDEHVRLGSEALPGQDVLITGFGKISYGEMIALGDFFSSVKDIENLASSGGNGKAQISYALWKVNPSRPRPPSDPVAEQAVEDRYNTLAAHNETHFSTGSSPGNSNREQYIARHQDALRNAWYEGLNPLVVRPSNWQAQEAFAAHFLTDAFAAGHIRTQRGAIQTYWEGLYPDFRDNLVQTISCFMASYINDVDNVGWVATVPMLTGPIAAELRARGGTQLASFSIGDLISKVLHDADNAGLDVVSPQSATGGAGRPLARRRGRPSLSLDAEPGRHSDGAVRRGCRQAQFRRGPGRSTCRGGGAARKSVIGPDELPGVVAPSG